MLHRPIFTSSRESLPMAAFPEANRANCKERTPSLVGFIQLVERCKYEVRHQEPVPLIC